MTKIPFLSLGFRSRRAISSFQKAAITLETIAEEAEVSNVKREEENKKQEEKFRVKMQKRKQAISDNVVMAKQNRIISRNIRAMMTEDITNNTAN